MKHPQKSLGGVLNYVALLCGVLQCVAVCCSVLQCEILQALSSVLALDEHSQKVSSNGG